jgi:iron transport multicopper oxidase
MRFLSSAVALLAAALFHGVAAVDPTDEYRDADAQQSGYLPNHNMDPAIVNSPQFGQLWKIPFNKGEQV